MTTEVNNQIIERSHTNGPLNSTTTGSATSTTTSEKSGNIKVGNFNLLRQTTSSSNQTLTETNQGHQSVATTSLSSSSTLTGGGNDESGLYGFAVTNVSDLSSETTVTHSIDADFLSISTSTNRSESSIDQSGNLFGGTYVYVESFGNEFASESTITNGPSTSISQSSGITTGEKTTTGNKKTGDFFITTDSESINDTTQTTTNQSILSESVTTFESLAESEKFGNVKQGTYEFNGYSYGSSLSQQTLTNSHGSGVLDRSVTEQIKISESTYQGTGNSISGRVEKEEKNSTETQAVLSQSNQTRTTERNSQSRSDATIHSISNTLLGTFQSQIEERAYSTIETTRYQSRLVIGQHDGLRYRFPFTIGRRSILGRIEKRIEIDLSSIVKVRGDDRKPSDEQGRILNDDDHRYQYIKQHLGGQRI